DGEDLVAAARVALDGDDGRLAGDDALALDVDERVCGPEIDRQIVREQAVEPVEDHRVSNLLRVQALAGTPLGWGVLPSQEWLESVEEPLSAKGSPLVAWGAAVSTAQVWRSERVYRLRPGQRRKRRTRPHAGGGEGG